MRPAMVCRGLKVDRAMRSTTNVEPQKAMAVNRAMWGSNLGAVGGMVFIRVLQNGRG